MGPLIVTLSTVRTPHPLVLIHSLLCLSLTLLGPKCIHGALGIRVQVTCLGLASILLGLNSTYKLLEEYSAAIYMWPLKTFLYYDASYPYGMYA